MKLLLITFSLTLGTAALIETVNIMHKAAAVMERATN